MKKAKVLIVEDHEDLVKLWKEILGDEVKVVWAKSLQEGEKMFEENPDLELVVMDCCVQSNKPDSMWLVQKIRKSGFKKPIVAKSSVPEHCKALLAVGASHSASSTPPGEIPELVLKLLKQAQK